MKPKLPFTEKFLWDIYKLIKAKDELKEALLPPNWYRAKGLLETLWPSYFEIRDWYWEEYKEKKKRERFANLVYKLQKNGYLKKLKVKDKSAIMLTPKALEKIFTIKIKMTERKSRKDKKWQMVLFDIPEEKKKERDLFRKALQYLGHKKLQKSIWVCPYDVLEETKDLIKRYKLEDCVELLLVQKIGLG